MPEPDAAEIHRSNGILPSRAADNLFWVGRYVERAEATLRLVRVLIHRTTESDDDAASVIGRINDLLEAWGGDPDSLRAEVIQGIVHFVELYHGEYDRERLIYSLRAYEPKFVYAAGKAEKELRGVKRYVNLFYRIYNGRRKHSTLPMKF